MTRYVGPSIGKSSGLLVNVRLGVELHGPALEDAPDGCSATPRRQGSHLLQVLREALQVVMPELFMRY